jgi:ABC-type glycerol-3-phosphate transport system substrate-binding protein
VERGRTTRREALRGAGLGLLAAGAGAAALTGIGSRSSAPAGRVRLRYWEKWSGTEGAAVQAMVDRFNASQDRIWVERIPVAETYSKAMVAIGGGDAPDVVGLFSWNVPYFAEARALMPLDEFPGGEALQSGHYTPAVEALLTHEGRLWGGANTCYTLALYANRERLAELDLDPDRPPSTLSELDRLIDRGVERDADGRLARVGFLPNVPLWWPYVWPFLFGGQLWDEGERRATLAEGGSLAAYEWVDSIADRHGRSASRSFGLAFERTMLSAADPFLSGAVAATVQGPWMANFAREFAPELDYTAGPVPVPDADFDPERPRGMLECDVIAIPRGCPHPEEAWEFVRFTQTQASQEALSRAHCKPSPLREVSAAFSAGHPNPRVDVHTAVANSPDVAVLPRTRAWKPYSDLIVPAFDAIWEGAPVEPALRGVQDRAQVLIDTVEERRLRRRGGQG